MLAPALLDPAQKWEDLCRCNETVSSTTLKINVFFWFSNSKTVHHGTCQLFVGNYTSRYLKHLSNTGRADTVVREIEVSSKKILGKLGDPKGENSFLIKGLVEGDVQSGKTGNFNAVINRAIDAGYRLIVVLSGLMDDLRVQTQERIQLDVIGEGKKGKVGVGLIESFGTDVGSAVQQVNSITSEDADFSSPLEKANFSMKPINILVCKKNVSILKNLLIWIIASR